MTYTPSTPPALRHEAWKVDGRLTQVLHLEAQKEPRLRVLVVPGNPGQAGYYTPFVHSLHSLLGGSASVLAVSHLGMDGAGLCPRGKVFSLEDQIQHKVALLREHLLREGGPPVVLIGHSIGAYIALNTLRRLDEEAWGGGAQVAKVVGLFPFLAVNPSCPRQARIRSLTEWYRPLGRLAAALRLLPKPAARWLLRRVAPDLEEHAAETALQLIHPTCVANALYMANCEFKALAAPPDWPLLRALGPRFATLGCPEDQWCPEWKWRAMLQEVPGVEAFWEADQSHAFCVTAKGSAAAASRVVDILSSSGLSTSDSEYRQPTPSPLAF